MSAQKKTWQIAGMHCPHCETAILRTVMDLDGLSSPKADYRTGTLTALWDENKLSEASLAERVAQAGYDLKRENKSLLRKALTLLGVALALFALYLLFALTPLEGLFSAFPTVRTGMSLGALFVVGLLTSLHCVAMCGGINLAQSAASAQAGRKISATNIQGICVDKTKNPLRSASLFRVTVRRGVFLCMVFCTTDVLVTFN